jgi:predicted nucleic acid-binding Zn ribbon protein
VLHAPAVHFKGKGFYNTNYGTRKRQRENAAEKSASESSSKDSSSESSSSSGEKAASSNGKLSKDAPKSKDAKPAVSAGG